MFGVLQGSWDTVLVAIVTEPDCLVVVLQYTRSTENLYQLIIITFEVRHSNLSLTNPSHPRCDLRWAEITGDVKIE